MTFEFLDQCPESVEESCTILTMLMTQPIFPDCTFSGFPHILIHYSGPPMGFLFIGRREGIWILSSLALHSPVNSFSVVCILES